MAKELSFPKEKIRVFLLEKVHPSAQETFEAAGYTVTLVPDALEGEELNAMLAEAHVVGVRSRTQIRAENLEHARRLLTIGCYSVGTDQVDLNATRRKAIPVFNAPHSSTRSVAELTIGNIFALSRKMPHRSAKMHEGRWEKSATGAFEVRGKTLGVIGYGHIGQQVALLGEAIGMTVLYYDVIPKLPLSRSQSVESLPELLERSDFVTLHVPGTPETLGMISTRELDLMKPGSYLLNLSRGKVVDLEALREALVNGKLAGAALDVYPEEPASNSDRYESILGGLENVILTPHIGGSTEEAQLNIGREVSQALIQFLDRGSTQGAVNFPSVHLPPFPNSSRLLWVHENTPGALRDVNGVIAELGVNVDAQYLGTHQDVGYLIMDLDRACSEELKERIAKLPQTLKTRVLY
ncbi:MAG: phosphoglycerate dehydrogenase [Bdellovibrionales bacterium]|nr:phosphoglycerate dehydrogenase [Bdellovibrionales bacterium]